MILLMWPESSFSRRYTESQLLYLSAMARYVVLAWKKLAMMWENGKSGSVGAVGGDAG